MLWLDILKLLARIELFPSRIEILLHQVNVVAVIFLLCPRVLDDQDAVSVKRFGYRIAELFDTLGCFILAHVLLKVDDWYVLDCGDLLLLHFGVVFFACRMYVVVWV